MVIDYFKPNHNFTSSMVSSENKIRKRKIQTISHYDNPLREKINQPSEYSWFTNTQKAEELRKRGVWVLFNLW